MILYSLINTDNFLTQIVEIILCCAYKSIINIKILSILFCTVFNLFAAWF